MSIPGRNDEVARSDFLLERADSGKRNDGLDTDVLQRSNVGLSRDLGRGMLVELSVSCEESDPDTGRQLGDLDRGRREPPRSFRVDSVAVQQ